MFRFIGSIKKQMSGHLFFNSCVLFAPWKAVAFFTGPFPRRRESTPIIKK